MPHLDSRRGRACARACIAAALLLSAGIAAAEQTLAGVVRAHDEAVLQSEIGGIIDRILVKEGDRVVDGQTLVELKNERQKIALDLARTTMKKAEAQLTETNVMLESAEKELKRITIAADALPRKDLEEHQDAVERLKATVAAQAAERAQAEQEVRLREHDLKETQLVAPFAGAITQIKVHRGDALKPMDTPVLEVVNLKSLYVEVLVPGGTARRLQVGQSVSVQVEREWMGRAGQVIGRVAYINPTVDAASRTVRMKVDIENPNEAVRPGMLAEVRFD